MSAQRVDLLFLFDVDNTLLDNDAVQDDLGAHLESEFGRAARERYWAIFETLRSELATPTTWGRYNAIGWRIPTIPSCYGCRLS